MKVYQVVVGRTDGTSYILGTYLGLSLAKRKQRYFDGGIEGRDIARIEEMEVEDG